MDDDKLPISCSDHPSPPCTEEGKVFVPQSVYGGYDPNWYGTRVALPRRRRRPDDGCGAFMNLCRSPRITFQLLTFQGLHAAFVVLACVAAWFIAVVCLLLSAVSAMCPMTLPSWLCWAVVLIANIDIRLYNSIAPQGQHIFVTLSTARDFGATLLYFACVKPVVAVATTGIPLSLVVLSVRWTVLSTVAFQEINSFQSSAPSIWPAVGGVGSIYLSVCVCRELAKKVCTTTRYVCCDHLDIYRYVYGLPIPMACQVPSHMMGVFGAGLIV
ncbi:hypothetical protein AaE_000579 [Aphanomyces astaci]|uniref:Uncharacterized protein n=1 Tax=Aphanomyces astaci TaxID=112090 RepID=A0A6A5AZJ6_APHAT|nr:hypothetical protein AaE_000579 [Aphanomyces astaci]